MSVDIMNSYIQCNEHMNMLSAPVDVFLCATWP